MNHEEERVEAAAAAMWEARPLQRTTTGAPLPFASAIKTYRDRYKGLARIALYAAAQYDDPQAPGIDETTLADRPLTASWSYDHPQPGAPQPSAHFTVDKDTITNNLTGETVAAPAGSVWVKGYGYRKAPAARAYEASGAEVDWTDWTEGSEHAGPPARYNDER